MKTGDLKAAYKTIMDDHFPQAMEVSFIGKDGSRQTLVYEKVTWVIDGVEKGLRYGENPGQEAAFYKLVNGNLRLGGVECIHPGNYLVSDLELLQSGKHPGKINITDIDNALNILRYFSEKPCTVIVKHNNPCGVAEADSLADSYARALMADRVAAFGGAIAMNREMDKATAEQIVDSYSEVVAAPAFAEGVMDMLVRKKNLRVMRIGNIEHLREFVGRRFVDFKSLMDGGMIAQWSYEPQALTRDKLLPASTSYKGTEYSIRRTPTDREYEDLLFGWKVEAGVTSNSVIYVKDGVTVGIGTGEQDRVGVAEIARDKAYRKMADRLCWERHKTAYNLLADKDQRAALDVEVKEKKGGLPGSVMVSDAFFPFRDGVDVGIREGVTAIIQPGGSLRDFESIEACNEANVAMVFTGERSFKH
ncbi:MAG: IMP cyclohydrolase [Chitinivibrionales bacterium]|nr:IMP cyclohydrolase [Chitinivibrionales bacterium]MBD3355909.1 IMP cyclohydrolase [Chitinivibrionales bacterium]